VSALKTYDRPINREGNPDLWPFWVVDEEGIIQVVDEKATIYEPTHKLMPGCWVTHRSLGGKGMVIAINDENLTVLWSKEPGSGDFSSFTMPLVRRVFASRSAQQLVSIQPMTVPLGGVFYMDYKYPDPIMEDRCNSGPWVSRMFWRSWRCMSTKTQSCWVFLRSFLSSWFSRRSMPVGKPAPSETPNENYQNQRKVLTNLLQEDPDRAAKLVDKWRTVLTPHGETSEPSEDP